jgi:nucleotide-binding universal stress UspA family protein
MYQRILVPLDGSELAECSLEHAKAIARGCNVAEMVLLYVVEPLPADTLAALSEGGADLITKAELENQQAPFGYLEKLTDKLKKEGIHCRSVVVNGRAAEEILDYSEHNQIDLIIISTHGRSGFSRWLFGSVADKIARHSAIPVLLISPSGCRKRSEGL